MLNYDIVFVAEKVNLFFTINKLTQVIPVRTNVCPCFALVMEQDAGRGCRIDAIHKLLKLKSPEGFRHQNLPDDGELTFR